MEKKLTLKLNEEFPELFVFRNFHHANYFVVECDDGWYDLIHTALSSIVLYIKNNHKQCVIIAELQEKFRFTPEDLSSVQMQRLERLNNGTESYPEFIDYPEVQQIKEKFGTLRLYLRSNDPFIRGVISMAESYSAYVCERCGDVGGSHQDGWARTLCDNCFRLHQEKK